MRTLTALAVVLAMGAGVPAAVAQQATPEPADPSGGAQQETMPGATGTGDTGTTGTMGTGETGTPPMGGDSAEGAAPMTGDTAPSATAATDTQAMPADMAAQESDHVLADEYIGAKIVARSDEGLENVGTVSDLVLGPDDKIVGVVVDVGGFLGVGAKPVGLSWASLTEERADGELLLKTELTRQDLEDAPEFKSVSDQQMESDPAAPGTGVAQ